MAEILSKRGKPKKEDGGYLYTFEAPNAEGDVHFWRCQSKNSSKCKARLHTDADNGNVLRRLGNHTHGSVPAGVEVARAVTRMKKRAAETQEPTSQLIHNCWHQAEMHGCLFHLVRNGQKELTTLQLHNRYEHEADFKLKCHMVFGGLPFVPIADLDEAVTVLRNYLPAELIPLLDWLNINYIVGRDRRNNARRNRPMFPPELWNLHERVMHDDSCTNNYAEAGHRRNQIELGIDHPTIWALIDGLKRVQRARDLFYEQLLRGDQPEKKRKKYRDRERRIKRIVTNYAQYTQIEYLRALAHNTVIEE